jgi:predicted RNase H-like nuclease
MGESTHSVGVDWASGNWLAVEYRGEEYECVTLAGDFEELWESFDPKPDRILVDVPIGLCDENDDETGERGRECDDFARSVLGSRSSSVFTPPSRQAAELARNEVPHETVSAKNRDIVGKGLSIQSYHIASGIAEVDAFLDPDEDERNLRRDRVEEAHPEVCFVAFNGGEFEDSKTSAVGFGERLSALENVVDEPGETFRKISHELAEHEDSVDVADVDVDDVLDAMALAITAGANEDERQTIPENPPEDRHELPIQMVYRAESPLEVST